jgi:hypothetical protein
VKWLSAEYRDFDGVPRAMLCRNANGTYYFVSGFDQARNRHSDAYAVYRLPDLPESEVCASWFGLETRAIARLTDLPVREFPFDHARREFLDFDPIAARLEKDDEASRR